MTELKTLKELSEKPEDTSTGDYFCNEAIFIETLKAEAIKWVKECRCREFTFEDGNKACSACYMMRQFFNLTEEDLK